MTLTSRRARPLDRTQAVRDARLIVIAAEGEKTEGIYFSIFQSSRVQVRIIPCEGGRSAPEHVLERLAEFRRNFEIGEGDEFWLAIDRDRWTEKSLKAVAQRCRADGIGLALSNPCFEVWLSMHYTDNFPPKMSSRDACDLIQQLHVGFSKAKYDPSGLFPRIPDAISVAKLLDTSPGARWPQKTGSRIYRITESILAKLNAV